MVVVGLLGLVHQTAGVEPPEVVEKSLHEMVGWVLGDLARRVG